MNSVEEFDFIAAQLEWLEVQLRAAPAAAADSQMTTALNALACARAVIVELSEISGSADLAVAAKAA